MRCRRRAGGYIAPPWASTCLQKVQTKPFLNIRLYNTQTIVSPRSAKSCVPIQGRPNKLVRNIGVCEVFHEVSGGSGKQEVFDESSGQGCVVGALVDRDIVRRGWLLFRCVFVRIQLLD